MARRWQFGKGKWLGAVYGGAGTTRSTVSHLWGREMVEYGMGNEAKLRERFMPLCGTTAGTSSAMLFEPTIDMAHCKNCGKTAAGKMRQGPWPYANDLQKVTLVTRDPRYTARKRKG